MVCDINSHCCTALWLFHLTINQFSITAAACLQNNWWEAKEFRLQLPWRWQHKCVMMLAPIQTCELSCCICIMNQKILWWKIITRRKNWKKRQMMYKVQYLHNNTTLKDFINSASILSSHLFFFICKKLSIQWKKKKHNKVLTKMQNSSCNIYSWTPLFRHVPAKYGLLSWPLMVPSLGSYSMQSHPHLCRYSSFKSINKFSKHAHDFLSSTSCCNLYVKVFSLVITDF